MERFKSGDRVCFVGDSITHSNTAIAYIVDFYRTNFPSEKIEFYNCGISGGSLRHTLMLYDEDVESYSPTHIVLMMGVNDSGIHLLANPRSKERYLKLEANFKRYKENIKKIYDLTVSRGIELILCTPIPYAEYQPNVIDVRSGGFALIQAYAEFIRDFSRENNILLCDYNEAVNFALQEEILYWDDGVHPRPEGQYHMAKALLYSQGLDIGEMRDVPEELTEWAANVQRLRNIFAAEIRVAGFVSDFCSLPSAERIEKTKQVIDDAKSGKVTCGEYSMSLFNKYLENKPKQSELTEYMKSFMRN